MTSAHEMPPESGAVGGLAEKDRCLACSYPLASERNVLAAINRLKEMLQHVGYSTGRLIVEEKDAGCVSVSLDIRPVDTFPVQGKHGKENNAHAALARPCQLGTSSCCSTNSLCKANACNHRNEEASKPTATPTGVQTSDIQFPNAQQAEPRSQTQCAAENAQAGISNTPYHTQQDHRQRNRRHHHHHRHHYRNKNGASNTGDQPLQPSAQKGDTDSMQHMDMHMPQSGDANLSRQNQQRAPQQKQHSAARDGDLQLGSNAMMTGPRTRNQQRAMNTRGQKNTGTTKKQTNQRARGSSLQQADMNASADQDGNSSQQSRLPWPATPRMATRGDIGVQRTQQPRLYAGVATGVGAVSGSGNQTATQQNEGQPMPASEGHELSRSLPGELQVMDQPQDAYAQLALGEDSLHGGSTLSNAVASAQGRVGMHLQQGVNQGEEWSVQGRREGGMTNSAQREQESTHLNNGGAGSVADVVARSVNNNNRNGYGRMSTGDGGPPAKRARTGDDNNGGMANTRSASHTGNATAAAATVGANASGMVNVGNMYACQHCNESYNNELDLRKHELKEHRSHPAQRNDDGRYPCALATCGQSFVRRHVMERHVRTVHLLIREFPCPSCNRVFADSSTREVHRSAVHEKRRPWICNICSTSFTQSSSLGKHKRRFHNSVKEGSAAQ